MGYISKLSENGSWSPTASTTAGSGSPTSSLDSYSSYQAQLNWERHQQQQLAQQRRQDEERRLREQEAERQRQMRERHYTRCVGG